MGLFGGISPYHLWVLYVIQNVALSAVQSLTYKSDSTAIGELCGLLLWFVINQAVTQEIFCASDYK